jgi:hypothetical protein
MYVQQRLRWNHHVCITLSSCFKLINIYPPLLTTRHCILSIIPSGVLTAGWGVLGPNAKARGWAPGPIKDAETGAAGWLLWVSLGLLLGDCFSELGLLLLQTALDKARKSKWLRHVGLKSESKLSWGLGSGGVMGSGKGRSWRGNEQRRLAGNHAESAAVAAGDYAKLSLADPEQGLGASSSSSSNGNATAQSCLELSPTGSASGLQEADDNPAGGNSSERIRASSMWQQQQQVASRAKHQHDAGSIRDSGGWMLSSKFWLPGLLLSTGLCSAILGPLLPLGMPLHEPLIAVSYWNAS